MSPTAEKFANSWCHLSLRHSSRLGLLLALLIAPSLISLTVNGQFVEPNLCTHRCQCLSHQGVVDCNRQDNLIGLPTNLPSGTSRLFIQEGNFPHPGHLGRRNMSGLENLVDLRINYCNLQSIEPRTFIGMTKLKHLDLSHNKLVTLATYTFYGLQLTKLYLEGQMAELGRHSPGLAIDSEAFHGLTASQINLRLNAIRSVEYATFAKVTDLDRLILSDNFITQLDAEGKFASYFDQSDRLLDLTGNPLVCSCQLAWLAVRSLDWSSRVSGLNMTCSIANGDRQPRLELRRLSADQLCPTSRVDSIVVNVLPGAKQAILDCTAVAMPRAAASLGSGRTDLLYIPSRGSLNPPEVAWRYEEGENQRVVKRLSKSLDDEWSGNKFAQGSRSISSTVSLNVTLASDVRRYTCTTWDDRKKAEEVVVALKVAPELKTIQALPPLAIDPTTLVKSDATKKGQYNEAKLLTDSSRSHYIFHKQFNMMEMICAVIGTFIATIIFLVVGIWCWRKGQEPGSFSPSKQTYYQDKSLIDRSYSPSKANGAAMMSPGQLNKHPSVFNTTNHPIVPPLHHPQSCFTPLLQPLNQQHQQTLSPHLSYLSGNPNLLSTNSPVSLFQQASSSNSSSDSPFALLNPSSSPPIQQPVNPHGLGIPDPNQLDLQFTHQLAPGSPYSLSGSHVYDVPRTSDLSQLGSLPANGGGQINLASSTLGRSVAGNQSLLTNGSD